MAGFLAGLVIGLLVGALASVGVAKLRELINKA